MIRVMRNSGEIVNELMALTSELWEALENEGTELKGRFLGIEATDQFQVSVFHCANEDRHLVLRKRMKNVG